MKKVFAIVLSLILVFALSITAFAAKSPTGQKYYNVTLQKGIAVEGVESAGVNAVIDEDGNVHVKADPKEGTFNSWSIYKIVKTNGKQKITKAVNGKDYEILSGSLNSKDLVIKPLADIVICGNYNGKITDPSTGKAKQDKSSKTGDVEVLYLSVIMLASLSVCAAAKKQLSK